MEICKNECSGKYFIYIHAINADQLLLVTPIGAIKSLEKKYFSEPIEVDENQSLLEQNITKQQYEAYQAHEKNRYDEPTEKFLFIFENLNPREQQDFYRYVSAKMNT